MFDVIRHSNEYDADCDGPGVKLIKLTFRGADNDLL